MTTALRAVAEAKRLAPIIQRTPYGWNNPVNVQEWKPNIPTYTWSRAGRVDHCGLAMNTVLFNIGLVMGRDFGNNAWTSSGLQWMRDNRRIIAWNQVEPGDLVWFKNAGSIYPATHIEMVTSRWLSTGFWTMGFNTDHTGRGIAYWRTPGYAVAVGRPLYQKSSVVVAPKPKPIVPPTPLTRRLAPKGDTMSELIEIHEDGDTSKHVEYWFMNCSVPSRVLTGGVEGPPDRRVSVSEWAAWLQSFRTFYDVAMDGAWTGPAQGRPVFRPNKPITPS